MDHLNYCRQLSDQSLLARLESLAAESRKDLSGLLACLLETDRRKLYAPAGYPSMFAYCVGKLRFSEGETARRLHAARTAARYPEILAFLQDGSLSLTAVSLLAPHRNRKDFSELLSRAQGLSQNKLELLLAEIAPERARRDCIRYLGHPPLPALPPKEELFAGVPEASLEGGCAPAEGTFPEGSTCLEGSAQPGEDAGLNGDRGPGNGAAADRSAGEGRCLLEGAGPRPKPLVRFSFTADEGLLSWVERARDLLRHKYPAVNLSDIFREALDALLEKRDPSRRIARNKERGQPFEKTAGGGGNPAGSAGGQGAGKVDGRENGRTRGIEGKEDRIPDRSRRIPRWVKDKVWERDGGRCSYVSPEGRRCEGTGMLEYDHVIPWALGGLSDDPDNIRLLCWTHNQWAARMVFGP
ncbi:MAG: HNH endonuclease signature motif containing protein [Elusimicrobiota bacterium]|jgi:hypothetical protein